MRLPQLTVSTLEVLLCVGIIGSQWAAAFTASGQVCVPSPIPGVEVGVVFPPATVVPCPVGVALPPLPPLHAPSMSVAVERSINFRDAM